MLPDFTLLIPTFNRHKYLERILKYYAPYQLKILVADSSAEPYKGYKSLHNVEYLHLPGENLPQKTAFALMHITTKYVAMCADDDFIIPDGIKECLAFLNSNPDFAAAQGNCLSYKKKLLVTGKLSFSVLYKRYLSYRISQNDPFERAERLFDPYRTIFTAIHYTKNLRLAYNERIEIKNLFLSEYLSGIIPIVMGKYIELPVFYQVREYAEDSGDKTTANLDLIIHNPQHREEYQVFLNYISEIICRITGCAEAFANQRLQKIFYDFSQSLIPAHKKNKLLPLAKRAVIFLYKIPTVVKKGLLKIGKGPTIRWVIKKDKDKKNLEEISNLIKEYAQSTG